MIVLAYLARRLVVENYFPINDLCNGLFAILAALVYIADWSDKSTLSNSLLTRVDSNELSSQISLVGSYWFTTQNFWKSGDFMIAS